MALERSDSSSTSCFRVSVLGPFALERDGEPVDTSRWQRRVATLFKLLATSPGHRRSRDEIVDILWPDAPPETGGGNLRLLVHRLRLTLGGDPSPVLSEQGWISLSPAYSWDVDLERFEMLARAGGDVAALEEAAALYRGAPLPEDQYDDWAARVREHAQRVWRDLCLRLAGAQRDRGAHGEAARWLERAVDLDPADEEAVRALMLVLGEAGRRAEALRRFQEFEARLKDELDVLPSRETLALVDHIRTQLDQAVAVAPTGSAGEAAEQRFPVGGFLGALPDDPLVAREEELERILFALDAVEGGAGRLVLLAGEAGAGKTRLAQEVMVVLRERGFLQAAGACRGRDRGVPFSPFLDLLAHLYAAAPAPIRAHAQSHWPQLAWLLPDQIPGAPDVEADGLDEQQHVFRAVAELLAAVADRRPVALLLDDLHWADEASLDLLGYLARRTRGHRIFLLGTYRDTEVGRDDALSGLVRDLGREGLVERVPVRRLSAEGTAALVAGMLGDMAGSDEFAEFVHRRTRGNPFFIAKLVRALGGRYRLVRQIGMGGMGRVFEAEDRKTGEIVAAKVMFARKEAEPKALVRFEQEGAVLAELDHPNIVRVRGTFLEEHAGCIVMERLEGRSLGQVMRSEDLSFPRIKGLMVQVAAALSAAHERGIAHRDVKPDNIMVLAGDLVKVTDFGIARILRPPDDLTTLTSTGMTMGTPLYMAPEQIEGKRVDGRSDIYSLGAVLYHLVTGRLPFQGDDPLAVAFQHVHEAPPPPRSINPDVPPDWEALILKALAKEPGDRFATARAMAVALEALGPDAGEKQQSRVGGPAAVKPLRRRLASRSLAAGTALAAVAALGLALLVGERGGGAGTPPTPISRPLAFTLNQSGGSGLGQFHGPTGMSVDGAGRVYVADYGNNRIQVFSPRGMPLAQFGTLGSGPGQLKDPTDIALGPAGAIFVVDYGNNRIQKVLPDGTVLDTIQHGARPSGGAWQPDTFTSAAVDRQGHIYATDLYNNRVVEFLGDSDNTVLTAWGQQGSGPGEFRTPTGIALDGNGNVYVVDTYNNRIEKFSSDGRFLAAWGRFGAGRGEFHSPEGVALDTGGNVYVADTKNQRIVKLSPAGRVLATWDKLGTGPGEFNQPSGVAVDRWSNIYATDFYNNRVEKLSPRGRPLWSTSGARPVRYR